MKGETMRTILILLSALFLSVGASASQIQVDDSDALQAAINARNTFVRALLTRDFTASAHLGMDMAMHEFARQIREEQGDLRLSRELLAQWSRSSMDFVQTLGLAPTDLGDHDPLFPWINQFLGKMSAKYGTIIYTLPIVKDILMVNYALPVVFKPRGGWQTDGRVEDVDNRIEYRKHFIPFANFVTYYTALISCRVVADRQGAPQLKRLCAKAADKLRFVMGRYIAPKVSDWIFRASNDRFYLGEENLRLNTVEELRRAIQE
jgi:hypothetical protein